MSEYQKYYDVGHFIVSQSFKALPKTIIGGWLYFGLLRKKSDTHYLILQDHLGDIIAALGYLAEYKKQSGITHITVVGAPAYMGQLCTFYEQDIDDVHYIKRWQIVALQYFARTQLGQYLTASIHNDRITFVWFRCHLDYRTTRDNKALSLPQYAKQILYKLPADTEIKRPSIPDVDLSAWCKKYSLCPGKTAYFSLEAMTVKCDIRGLCERLADKLLAAGYQVITLTANDRQAPVKNTQAIPCSLAEAYRLIEHGGTLIGLRSGFLDVMVFARCKIISIDDGDYGEKDFFDLEKWGVNPDCHTVVYRQEEQAFQQILPLLGLE